MALIAVTLVGIAMGAAGTDTGLETADVALAVAVGDRGLNLGVTGSAMRLPRMKPDSFSDA